ncbi:MAG: hypothetical protein LBT73_03610 [Tannerellaceae bacterium]|nr:hypothetical protein [Tannerellaceae bacterium]
MTSVFRHIVALLLLTIFATPFVGKSLHLLSNDSCHAHHVHYSGDDDCPVCHFTLSWFTETEATTTDFLPSVCSFTPTLHCTSILIRPTAVRCLRGPPVI